MDGESHPGWLVTLVCGASGVGKSTVASGLAARYGTRLTQADDILTALTALTTAEQLPVLHYWRTHPELNSWSPERIAEQHFAVADAVRPGLQAVVHDHLKFATPVVFEGDYLLPDLVHGLGAAVRAVVLSEPDANRVAANFGHREPEAGEQSHRARVSVLVGVGLAGRAARIGVPVVAVRPWPDVVDRVDRALRG